MPVLSPKKRQSNPDALLAIIELRRLGWDRRKIMLALGLTQATYYRRVAEIDRFRAAHAAEAR